MVRLPGDLQQLGEFDESALSKLSYANGGLELKNKQLRLPLTPLKIKDARLYRLAPDFDSSVQLVRPFSISRSSYLFYALTGSFILDFAPPNTGMPFADPAEIPINLNQGNYFCFDYYGSLVAVEGLNTISAKNIDIPIIPGLSLTQLNLNIEPDVITFGGQVEALSFINAWARKLENWLSGGAGKSNADPFSTDNNVTTARVNISGRIGNGRLDGIHYLFQSAVGIPIIPGFLSATRVGGTITNALPGDFPVDDKRALSLSGLPVTAIPTGGTIPLLSTIDPDLLSIDLDAKENRTTLEGSGRVKALFGLLKGRANVKINKSEGTLDADASYETPFLKFGGRLKFNEQGDLYANGQGTIKLGGEILGFQPSIRSNTTISYFKNKPLSESNIVAWQIVELPHPWKPFAKVYEKQGIRVSLTGDINLLKGDQIDQIVAKQGLANSNQEIPLTEGSFNIPVGYQYFLIDANWQNAANDVPITLTAPDGTVLTPDDLATGQSVAGKVARIVPEMVEATGKEVAIANPQAGTWQISIPDNLGVGNVKFTGWGKSASPTVKINSISIDRKQSNIAISYEATDSSPNAQVDLYYDPTGNGFDGYVIEEGLPLSGTYNWKVSGLPSDDYHVYAVVKDDENVSEASYYKDAVSWVQPKAPDQVQGVEAQWLGGNRIQVSWSPVRGASFYEITYTSDASGAEETDQTHVVSTKEDVPHIILPNLQRGQVYRFEVKAINKDETFSAPSTPVIAAVGNGSLAPLDAGEWQAAVVAGTNYRATVPIELDEILSLENAPVGATLDPNTGEFTWAVPADASGVYPIEILSINAFGEQQEITHNLFVSSQEITHYPSTINLDNFSDLSNLQINGSAEQSGSVLRLVSNRNNRSGNAFSETPFDITDKTSWQTHFKFKASSRRGKQGANGFTFTLKNFAAADKYLNYGLQSVGEDGDYLGYSSPYTRSSPSLAISFDMHKNAEGSDPSNNFVGILSNGNIQKPLQTASPSFHLNDGKAHDVWITYDSPTQLLKVFLAKNNNKPQTPLISYKVDLLKTLGEEAFAGFTAATGDSHSNIDILNWQMSLGNLVSSSDSQPIVGTADNDFLTASSQGSSILIGGDGADFFQIANRMLPTTPHHIHDFDPRMDTIGFSQCGITNFKQLTLTQQGDNTLVSASGQTIAMLDGIQATSLNKQNFCFV